ncbi:hypothetical protein QVD17_31649 [Tagetes erecta]|uniref:Uncharacterized protein n=1 Tax=Tagetes erecta TaxID=13708 RepID=A0AAD8NPF2_TARER|nr:hypothetical protein QVD17_31649 [Tagetes erecta]
MLADKCVNGLMHYIIFLTGVMLYNGSLANIEMDLNSKHEKTHETKEKQRMNQNSCSTRLKVAKLNTALMSWKLEQ